MSIQGIKPVYTVLGGGISGLSSAWNLAKRLGSSEGDKKPAIYLVEATNRLGGWIRSEKKELGCGSTILTEKGPRTLRVSNTMESRSVFELIEELNLYDEVIFCPKSAPASKNRFIYYNNKICSLPASPSHLFTRFSAPVRPIFSSIVKDLFTPRNTNTKVTDESISEFLGRRLDTRLDDRLISAVLAGIYAGNSSELSAKIILNNLWRSEQISGKILTGLNKAKQEMEAKISKNKYVKDCIEEDKEEWNARVKRNPEFWGKIEKSSIISFRNGIQTLTDSIKSNLQTHKNVEFITDDPCTKISRPKDNTIDITLKSGRTLESGITINTIPVNVSGKLFEDEKLPSIFNTKYSSVVVVNIAYKGINPIPYRGFGFLVPRDAWESTDVIGVVFDSQCLPEQDRGSDISRFTVMMGGPMFDQKFKTPADLSEDLLAEKALTAMKNILNIHEQPLDMSVSVARNCIPLYNVGYHDELVELNSWLETWDEKLLFSGAAYGSPSVNSCVLRSKLLVNKIATRALYQHGDSALGNKMTGIDDVVDFY
ncbi:Protoporphyrinogen oxidase [Zancudomyces culisetae]|uniref:Protoporphyrinogen oxidase n=1 Tax=Zancudomyces culisetae TaxID=1213189 RepID=A0A1R1PK54_ZANCU|nr:Protoporphyrinogen oxidase [Zancudomyces culisetae]|eukprot:OMH81334.1 Protoporphyrinogen oxidase [Zancudomyces culisetae]